MSNPIQDEPESTIGRKPARNTDAGAGEGAPARSGREVRREENESEAGSKIREHEQSADRPPNFEI